VELFNTLSEVIYRTDRLKKSSYSPPPSPLSRKKYHYYKGRGKSALGGGDTGGAVDLQEDSEALRRMQEMELVRRGILISASTQIRKSQKQKVKERTINIIEQNKMNPKIKRMR
jgi:hypothetical protein